MSNMSKSFALILILIMSISSMTLLLTLPFGVAQTGTKVGGIISSDTKWNEAGSPYSLTGPVAVNQGVTLTIEVGTTVNLNNFYIQVNGTLIGIGSNTNRISFNGGQIISSAISNGWNEQTGSGCIIENAVLTKTSIFSDNSIKINDNIFNDGAGVSIEGSSILSNNIIAGGITAKGASIVINNTIMNGITTADSCIISNNNITNSLGIWIIDAEGAKLISDNIISGGATAGINLAAVTIIQRNLIINNGIGISVRTSSDLIIQNNTIMNNTVGLSFSSPNQTIIYNNFQNNSNHNVVLGALNANATYNWWGTTDTQTINQSIYDSKNDFSLGTVSFIPFLTAPNSQAMPNVNTPIPTPYQSSSPSSTPTIPEFPLWTIPLLFTMVMAVGLSVYFKKYTYRKFGCV